MISIANENILHSGKVHCTLQNTKTGDTKKKMNDYLRFALTGITVVFCVSCAKQGMPPGGPEDRKPPRVMQTLPEPNAVHVPRNQKIQLTFDENIQSSSGDAVFISPYIEGDIKYKWKGKKLLLELPDSLQSNTTYVITLGTSIKDYQNNALKDSYTLAFSTGDSLDQGMLFGQVLNLDDAKGIDVWAYHLMPDSACNPCETAPDYIVQCSQKGEFRFSHIAAGTYRLFAVRDRVSNRLYDSGEDPVGISAKDIVLSKENHFRYGPVFLQMVLQDTTGPRLLAAVPVHGTQYLLRFDEAIELTDSCLILRRSLTDSTQMSVISQYYLEEESPKVVHVIDPVMTPGQYLIQVHNISDLNHNTMTSANAIEFEASAEEDTTKPALLRIQPKAGQRNVHPDSCLSLVFSEPMDTTDFAKFVALTDTAGNPADCSPEWKNCARLDFCPSTSWTGLKLYEVTIEDSGLSDLSGNMLPDSTFLFTIINPDTLSEISGTIERDDRFPPARVVLTATSVTRLVRCYRITVPKGETQFLFKKLMPGQYVLQAFLDLNDDETFTYGAVWPYQPAEPCYALPDTITARSRWPNEGNQFILK